MPAVFVLPVCHDQNKRRYAQCPPEHFAVMKLLYSFFMIRSK